MNESEQKWIKTNKDACAVLRQLHDMLALSSLPPRRTWVGLTDEEVGMAFRVVFPVGGVVFTNGATEFAKTIERKLKEKNT